MEGTCMNQTDEPKTDLPRRLPHVTIEACPSCGGSGDSGSRWHGETDFEPCRKCGGTGEAKE